MLWTIIGVAYIAIWLVYGWKLTVHFLEYEIQNRMAWQSIEEAKKQELGFVMFQAYMIALVWPVSMSIRAFYRLVVQGSLLVTPTEKMEQQKKELAALRKLAQENGLPMPEVEK